jgi:CheY-specific phosphatase CheX
MTEIEEKIVDLVKKSAQKRMQSHSGLNDIEISKMDDSYNRQVHANWMALILISGNDVRVTFKAHFNISELRLVMIDSMGMSSDEVSDALVLDYMKEYCNLTAGLIKQVFEENDVSVGISLPVVTRGFDEIFYKAINKNEIQENWELLVNGQKVICTPCINIFNPDKLDLVEKEETTEEDDGDIDFL